MRWHTVRGYVLTALVFLGLSLSALLSAAETESWSIVDESLTESNTEVSGLKNKLSTLRDEKTHLFNETYAVSNEDRSVAKEPRPQNRAQEAQIEDINTEIRATESKIDRKLKKHDYLTKIRKDLHDEESLDRTLNEVDHSISTLENDLRPISERMHQLAQTCKECKVVLNSLDREPASQNSQLSEFRQLMRKRNQIEGSLDSYGLQKEALRDVKAYANGKEAVSHPHRFTSPRSLDLR